MCVKSVQYIVGWQLAYRVLLRLQDALSDS